MGISQRLNTGFWVCMRFEDLIDYDRNYLAGFGGRRFRFRPPFFVPQGDGRFSERPVRMHDFPVFPAPLVNLRAVPLHRALAAVAQELQGKHRRIARYLHPRVEDFVTLDLNLAAQIASYHFVSD